jgi:metal-responsive CopG/Arc/MetJ family transcriptional regulator
VTKYRTVGIPDELIKEINKELEISKEHGYRTHSEFIIDAIRRRLDEIRKLRKEK